MLAPLLAADLRAAGAGAGAGADDVALDTQLDISLRIMDAGGQTYFDFLKPMLMQDRAVVLLCVKGRDDGSLVAEVQEYLDTLSTLMHGGVVVPVVTHADEISSMGPLHRLWSLEVVPLFEQYSGRLRIDPTLVAVSSVTGTGIDELKERLRISATMVGGLKFSLIMRVQLFVLMSADLE